MIMTQEQADKALKIFPKMDMIAITDFVANKKIHHNDFILCPNCKQKIQFKGHFGWDDPSLSFLKIFKCQYCYKMFGAKFYDKNFHNKGVVQ